MIAYQSLLYLQVALCRKFALSVRKVPVPETLEVTPIVPLVVVFFQT